MDGAAQSSYADHRRLERAEGDQKTMTTTTTAPGAKELRREAKRLNIAGYEDMTREELTNAVATANGADEDTTARVATKTAAKKTAAKKAAPAPAATEDDGEDEAPAKPAKKTASKKAAPKAEAPAPKAGKSAKGKTEKVEREAGAEGPNPFRPNTNLWHITEALMRGGKRSTLVARLLPKLEYNPRVQSADDFDAELETDRRLKVVGYLLKNRFGFTYVHEGRGKDATIKVIPPES